MRRAVRVRARGTMEIALREPRVYLPEHAPPLDKTRLGFVITEARDEGALDAVGGWSVHLGRRFRRSGVYVRGYGRARRRVRRRCILSSLRARSPCRGITCCF